MPIIDHDSSYVDNASPVLALEAERRHLARLSHRRALCFGVIGIIAIATFRLTIVGQVLPVAIQVLILVVAFAPAVVLFAKSDRSHADADAAKRGAAAEREVSDSLSPLEDEGWRKWNNQAIPGFERMDIDLVLRSPRGRYYCIEIKANHRRADEDVIHRRCRAQAAALRKTLKSKEFVTALICFPDTPAAPRKPVVHDSLHVTPLSHLIALLRELDGTTEDDDSPVKTSRRNGARLRRGM